MNRLVPIALLVLAASARAQQPRQTCTYDTCALRIVDGGGYFAPPVVVRGRVGYSVAPARRSATLGTLFAANDSAAVYYARFETHERRADWAGWVGTGLMVTGFVADLVGDGGLFSGSFLLYGGGLAVTFGVSVPLQNRASSDLAGAIWWYNQSLRVSDP